MPEFIIRWNGGCGDSYDVVEAKNLDEAMDAAYAEWREEAETQADYEAIPWTREAAEKYGIE